MKNKKVILSIVVVVIVGTIIYLESLKVSPAPSIGENADIVLDAGMLDDRQGGTLSILEHAPMPDDGGAASEIDASAMPPPEAVSKLSTQERIAMKAENFELAKEITTPDAFLNTDAFKIGDLIGKKVIVVDFWTYSCINCQRTLPYLNAWHEKYKDEGLVIVGMHTPEFEFEKDLDNVSAAVKKFGVKYPVVLDNDFSTWFSYRNRYWPRKYIIDIDGFIVYDHIGEGAYDVTERKIQELLQERARVLGLTTQVAGGMVDPGNAESVKPAIRTPEIYFGAWRNERLGNGIPNAEGVQMLTLPDDLFTSVFYLEGDWNIAREYAESASVGAKIVIKYQGEKVFFVASAKDGARVRVLRDGKPLGAATGSDVESDSTLFIQRDGLYRIIEDPEGQGEHVLEIIIEDPGLQAFTFTFG